VGIVGQSSGKAGDMKTTDYFECESCHVGCRVDSEGPGPRDSTIASQLTIRHCPDSKGIVVFGKVTNFQEWRRGLWVAVQRRIDAA
jgi:hypothetical protein